MVYGLSCTLVNLYPNSVFEGRAKNKALAGQAEILIGHLYNLIQSWSHFWVAIVENCTVNGQWPAAILSSVRVVPTSRKAWVRDDVSREAWVRDDVSREAWVRDTCLHLPICDRR